MIKDMTRNFETNKSKISDLATYLNTIKNDSLDISVRFDNNLYSISYGKIGWKEGYKEIGRDMQLSSNSMQRLIDTLGWTTDIILAIKDRLRTINCKAIHSDNGYFLIEYGSLDHCTYFYIVSTNSFADGDYYKKIKVAQPDKNVIISSTCAEWDNAYKRENNLWEHRY